VERFKLGEEDHGGRKLPEPARSSLVGGDIRGVGRLADRLVIEKAEMLLAIKEARS
jgi:hypothetical protein